jgi:serine/threonine protein kinase
MNSFIKSDPSKDYKFVKKIGRGASSKVYKVYDRKDQAVYAMKMIKLKDWEYSDL